MPLNNHHSHGHHKEANQNLKEEKPTLFWWLIKTKARLKNKVRSGSVWSPGGFFQRPYPGLKLINARHRMGRHWLKKYGGHLWQWRDKQRVATTIRKKRGEDLYYSMALSKKNVEPWNFGMWDSKRSAVNKTCTNLNLNDCGSAAGCGRSPHRSTPVKVIKLSCQSVWATQLNLFFATRTLNLLRRCLAVKSPGFCLIWGVLDIFTPSGDWFRAPSLSSPHC